MAAPVGGPRTYVTLKESWSQFGPGKAKVLSNIYAVVVESTTPVQSKGSDHYIRVLVRDESTEEWTNHATIELMLFSPEVWPIDCFQAGDIIRMHDVSVRRYDWTQGEWVAMRTLNSGRESAQMNMYTNADKPESKPQLFGKVKRESPFRFFLFSADVEPSLTSMPHSAPFSTELLLTDVDVAMLARMKQYNMRLAASTAARAHLSGEHQASSSLRNVSKLMLSALPTPDVGPQTELVDIICKVLSIDRRDPSMAVVHVWDGSDCPPLLPDFSHAPPAARAAAAAARAVAAQTGPPALPLHMLGCRRPLPLLSVPGSIAVVQPEELPELGTAVPLLLPAAVATRAQQDVWGPHLGNWVKIRNVAAFVACGQVQLLYTDNSNVSIRSATAQGQIKAKYKARLNRPSLHAPPDVSGFSSRVKDLRGGPLAPVSVRHLLQSIHMGLPGLYRLHVRAARYHPPCASQAVVPLGELGLPVSEAGAGANACGHTFALKLMLEDATGQVDAVLLGSDAEAFFSGLSPFVPNSGPQATAAAAALQQRLDALTSLPSPSAHSGMLSAAAGGAEAGRSTASGVWLDTVVKIAFLDTPRYDDGQRWTMPCIRIVDTVGCGLQAC